MKKIFLLAVLAASPAFCEPADPACLFDGNCRPAPSAPAVSSDEAFLEGSRADLAKVAALSQAAKERSSSPWSGAKKGAQEGATLGFYAGISPAAGLLSEGYGRRMSRAYDGARGDNDWAGAYMAAGIVLGVILYIPALALGLVGGLIGTPAGAVAETASPGSTSQWDAEGWLFD